METKPRDRMFGMTCVKDCQRITLFLFFLACAIMKCNGYEQKEKR